MEKIWFVGGDESGEDRGRVILIFGALCIIKYMGFLWRSALAAALQEIGLNPTMVYPKVWIRSPMRLDGYKYYEMILVYVNNIMIVYHLGDEVARKIGNFYKIKEGIQGLPTWYLGADTEKIQIKHGCEIWKTSSRYYITNDIETVEALLLEDVKCEVL